jgi:hypothetical protein
VALLVAESVKASEKGLKLGHSRATLMWPEFFDDRRERIFIIMVQQKRGRSKGASREGAHLGSDVIERPHKETVETLLRGYHNE